MKKYLCSKIYSISKKLLLTHDLAHSIFCRIEILYPSTYNSIIIKTGENLFKLYFIIIMSIVGLILFSEFSLYYTVLTIIVVYTIGNSKVYNDLNNLELNLLIDLDNFISEIRFSYHYCNMVEESLKIAIEKSHFKIAIHGEQLLKCIKEDSLNNSSVYKEVSPNEYFLTLYYILMTVIKYGDTKENNESILLKNLVYLKDEINIEVLKRKRIKAQFLGLSTVSILPIFAIRPIENWSINNMPEMSLVYNGKTGIISTLFICILSVVIYKMINKLKMPKVSYLEKNMIIEKIIENEIIHSIILKYIKITGKKSEHLNSLLRSISYPYNLKEFILKRFIISFIWAVMTLIILYSININIYMVVFFSLVVFIIVFIMEYYHILINRQILIMERESEINRFQTIILIMKKLNRVDVMDIMENISGFAVVFKDVTERIKNKIYLTRFEEFRNIKEETGFIPLKKFLDGFIVSDELGIDLGFGDIEQDRKYYIDKHKQENEDLLEKKVLIAKLISFIPLCIVILLKLIIPFVMEGMDKLQNL